MNFSSTKRLLSEVELTDDGKIVTSDPGFADSTGRILSISNQIQPGRPVEDLNTAVEGLAVSRNWQRQVVSRQREFIGVLEAAIGIEPMNKGFADLCLTTWLRRPKEDERSNAMKGSLRILRYNALTRKRRKDEEFTVFNLQSSALTAI